MSQAPGELPVVNESQKRREEEALERRMAEIRHKLLVLSGKGGVGKSTVAANLAVSLSRAGKHVGLLDVDVHGPSIPGIMGLEGQSPALLGEEILPVGVNERLAVMSMGFLLASGRDAVIWRGPRKYGAIQQFLKDVFWGPLDYLVVDSPPGTGDEPLSVAQLVGGGAEAVVVTTPQRVAIADVRRCVAFCEAVSLPVRGIVENMSGLDCPHCGKRVDLFGSGGGRALAEEMGVPFLGAIPIDPAVVVSGDAGAIPSDPAGQTPAARAFDAVVGAILEGHGGQKE
ncbi:MAG: Mrp/NBP35 family ATP-binding protein [Pirellulales bacterium]|nr:Mrp/NBP35 family ATP-binding protein [Pirellulales bacterium]